MEQETATTRKAREGTDEATLGVEEEVETRIMVQGTRQTKASFNLRLVLQTLMPPLQ